MDRMCQACSTQFNGRAVGNLLPLLKVDMDRVLDPDLHTLINERQGTVVLAHKELFPQNRNVLVMKFETRDELIESVLDSCMFPFFSMVNEYQELRSMDSLQFLGKLIATNLLLANIESNANCSSFVQTKMITQ